MKPVQITFSDPISISMAMQGFALLAAKAQEMHSQLAALAQEASKPDEPPPAEESAE
jgi:hypothetical protein